eukprot:TRINITY_DN33935_c0_g1_i1.p1 TRINITY_DN33935_c0_g1~~TRINITY_DN33935_c0_g1_i1.p1  ORF type:complete len:540 (+),score=238.91 TRINITY_DN33935_c0_g1_i1:51-1622(+)
MPAPAGGYPARQPAQAGADAVFKRYGVEGRVPPHQLENALQLLGLFPTADSLEAALRQVRADPAGVTEAEFRRVVKAHAGTASAADRLAGHFRALDRDGCGWLPAADFERLLRDGRERMDAGEVAELMAVADPDSSGRVDYEAFLAFLTAADPWPPDPAASRLAAAEAAEEAARCADLSSAQRVLASAGGILSGQCADKMQQLARELHALVPEGDAARLRQRAADAAELLRGSEGIARSAHDAAAAQAAGPVSAAVAACAFGAVPPLRSDDLRAAFLAAAAGRSGRAPAAGPAAIADSLGASLWAGGGSDVDAAALLLPPPDPASGEKAAALRAELSAAVRRHWAGVAGAGVREWVEQSGHADAWAAQLRGGGDVPDADVAGAARALLGGAEPYPWQWRRARAELRAAIAAAEHACTSAERTEELLAEEAVSRKRLEAWPAVITEAGAVAAAISDIAAEHRRQVAAAYEAAARDAQRERPAPVRTERSVPAAQQPQPASPARSAGRPQDKPAGSGSCDKCSVQ